MNLQCRKLIGFDLLRAETDLENDQIVWVQTTGFENIECPSRVALCGVRNARQKALSILLGVSTGFSDRKYSGFEQRLRRFDQIFLL